MYWHRTSESGDWYEGMIESVLFMMRIPSQLLDDARQEAYIGVLRAERTWNPERGASLRTFTETCVRGAVQDWRLRMWRAYQRDMLFVEAYCGDRRVDYWPIVDQRIDLQKAIAGLKPRQKRAVEILLNDKPVNEIGRVFGVTPGRAHQFKNRTIQCLQNAMGAA